MIDSFALLPTCSGDYAAYVTTQPSIVQIIGLRDPPTYVLSCFVNCTFTGNTADSTAGALLLLESTSHNPLPTLATGPDSPVVRLQDCVFNTNRAGSSGSAIFADIRIGFVLDTCIFENNVAGGDGTVHVGSVAA